MQIKVKVGVLRDALQQASYTLDTKAGSVGTWMYLIAQEGEEGAGQEGKLFIYSTNLGLVRTLSRIPATVSKEGEVVILPHLLRSTLLSLPSEEEVEISAGTRLVVKYGQIKSELAIHADAPKSSTFLKSVPFNATPDISVSASTLVDIVNRILFCTASGEGSISEGPYLSSVYIETEEAKLRALATNRIIAGQMEALDPLVKAGFKVALHRDALQALKSLLVKRKGEEVSITKACTTDGIENEVFFRFSDVIMGARLLAKPYPKAVTQVFKIPVLYTTTAVNRKNFLEVMGRLSAFAEKQAFALKFTGDKVTLSTKGYNSAFQEALSLEDAVKGSFTVGLGIPDVMGALSSMVSENVVVRYHTDEDHVYLLEGHADSNVRYVLSPVTLAWSKEKAA